MSNNLIVNSQNWDAFMQRVRSAKGRNANPFNQPSEKTSRDFKDMSEVRAFLNDEQGFGQVIYGA